jgi:hypothetical protein
MKPRRLLLFGPLILCAALVGAGWLLRGRAGAAASSSSPDLVKPHVRSTPVVVIGPVSPSPDAPAPASGTPLPKSTPGPLTMKDFQEGAAGRDFVKLFNSAELQAKLEVQTLLRSRGGAAALEHIQDSIERPIPEPLQVAKTLYLARLIAYVAQQRPDSAPAAAELTRKLLAASSDDRVRFQLMAGALGYPSTSMSFTEPAPGETIRWTFTLDADDGIPTDNPYRASLVSLMGSDPTLTSVAMGMLPDSHDVPSRLLGARALGALPPIPGSIDLLRELTRKDPIEIVRREAFKSLLKVGGADAEAYVLAAAGDAALPESHRNSAILALPASIPFDRNVEALFRSQISNPEAAEQRPAIAEAGLRYLSLQRGNAPLRDLLQTLIRQEAGNESMLQLYTEKILQAGLSEFVPVFRALEAGETDPEAKKRLGEAVAQIEHCEEYAAMSARLVELEKSMRLLEIEANRPQATPQQRAELSRRLKELGTEFTSVTGKRQALLPEE